MSKEPENKKRLNIIVQGIIIGTDMAHLSQKAVISTYVINETTSFNKKKYYKLILLGVICLLVVLLLLFMIYNIY